MSTNERDAATAAPIVDTDVLIRLVTGDDLDKQARAAALFVRVETGVMMLAAPDTVIADAVFVLSSPRLYRLSRAGVRDLLAPLVRLPGFDVQNKRTVLDALDLYAIGNSGFGDAMIVASMRQVGASTLYSFDRGFDRIPMLARVEPPAEPPAETFQDGHSDVERRE